jgi:hypothetical protein
MAAFVRVHPGSGDICAGPFFLMRIFAGLVVTTLLMTGAASASSFVMPEAMSATLGPSMIALGEPASEPAAAENRTTAADAIAKAIDQDPLEYPFPGGKPPLVGSSDGIAGETPLNYPAPVSTALSAGNGGSFQAVGDVDFIEVSHSIIAMAPEPGISFEQVAAVDKDAGDDDETVRHGIFGPGPTVIRGGVVDDGSAAEVTVPDTPAQRPAVASSAHEAPASPPPEQPGEPTYTPPPPPGGMPRTKVQ